MAAAALLLGVARLLPETSAGLALRLAAATGLVLLTPGALVLRALGGPSQLGVTVAAAVIWSLALLAAGMALVFAVGASILVALIVPGAVALFTLALPGGLAIRIERRDVLALLGVAAAGGLLAAGLWWSTGTAGGSVGPTAGDALFHLARVRKLAELPSLSLTAVDEFRDGGLHPGYAFPLWHGAVALVARLAGVDAAPAFLYLPAILTPLALVVVYGAGEALFGTWAGGVATAAAQTAVVAVPREGLGTLQFLSQPGAAARLLLLPALLGVVFAFAVTGGRRLVVSAAAGSFVLILVHPSYLVYAVLLLAGFAAARFLLARGEARAARRAGGVLAAILVPAGLVLAWLAPLIRQAAAYSPSQAETQRALARYAGELVVSGSSYSLSPRFVAWGGVGTVAALAAVPLAVLAGRRAWAACVLGGTALLGAIALVPPLFTRFADLLSLSQALRVGGFLPLAFALAGVAELAEGAGAAGPILALGGGVAADLVYPHAATGAVWATWLAVGGAVAGLAVGASGILRRLEVRAPGGRWAALAAVAFLLPLGVAGYSRLHHDGRLDPFALTPGLARALDDSVGREEVVLSNVETSYRISADAPVYVAASLPGHVARTRANRPYERQWDAVRFFFRPEVSDAERWAILRRYGVGWVVLDRRQRSTRFVDRLRLVYSDGRYGLYRVSANLQAVES